MSNDIKIGKHTLESLTTGMYSDPRIIYREYIQNSTDAIDAAIKKGLLKGRHEGEINISINKNERSIVIFDNGAGIPFEKARSVLCDVGNSSKRHEENRGFRGIGRLGGLSYASELYFTTSSFGEKKKAIVKWDCSKLRVLLQPGKHDDYDMTRVIDEVVSVDILPEKAEAHYFKVEISGVNENHTELISSDIIAEYLSEIAPVPFDSQRFPFYTDSQIGLKKKLLEIDKPLEEYNIFLNDNPDPIYKPYKTWFTTKNKRDDILRIDHIIEKDENGELLFWGWYAITNFYGQVQDLGMKGLRVRKNNILIGDESILETFFSQERFNLWFIGEIYVYDKELIPNARRDNFEKNQAYVRFKDKLEKYTRGLLSKLPHNYSMFNSALDKIEKSEKELEEIENRLEQGISSEVERKKIIEQKEVIREKLEKNEEKLKKTKGKLDPTKARDFEYIINKSTEVKKKTESVDKKIDNVGYSVDKDKALSHYPRDVKKVVIKIFEVIDKQMSGAAATQLKKDIIEELKQKVKDQK